MASSLETFLSRIATGREESKKRLVASSTETGPVLETFKAAILAEFDHYYDLVIGEFERFLNGNVTGLSEENAYLSLAGYQLNPPPTSITSTANEGSKKSGGRRREAAPDLVLFQQQEDGSLVVDNADVHELVVIEQQPGPQKKPRLFEEHGYSIKTSTPSASNDPLTTTIVAVQSGSNTKESELAENETGPSDVADSSKVDSENGAISPMVSSSDMTPTTTSTPKVSTTTTTTPTRQIITLRQPIATVGATAASSTPGLTLRPTILKPFACTTLNTSPSSSIRPAAVIAIPTGGAATTGAKILTSKSPKSTPIILGRTTANGAKTAILSSATAAKLIGIPIQVKQSVASSPRARPVDQTATSTTSTGYGARRYPYQCKYGNCSKCFNSYSKTVEHVKKHFRKTEVASVNCDQYIANWRAEKERERA